VLAITSHVPHLIAYNIVGTAADLEEVTQSEVIKFSAGGFRDFTRIAASDAYYIAAKENIQAHGGMGFTWEVDCHLFYRRAKLLAVQAGGPGVWREKLVRRLELKNAA
jgi:hypothetical protein